MTDLVRLEPLRRHAEPSLQVHIVSKDLHVGHTREHEEIAAPVQPDRLLQLLFEAFEHGDALERQADIDLASELEADAAGALAGCALAEQVAAIQQQHITLAAQRKMVGDAGAHHAPTDDRHLCVAWLLVHECAWWIPYLSLPRPLPFGFQEEGNSVTGRHAASSTRGNTPALTARGAARNGSGERRVGWLTPGGLPTGGRTGADGGCREAGCDAGTRRRDAGARHRDAGARRRR